jgi:UDP-N-acetylmuramoyl-tripeptide--D-alanyl-D-alanine ligase
MPCFSPLIKLTEVLAAKPLNLSDTALGLHFTNITTDTRSLKPGEVFLALRGEKFDGHEFVSVAIAKGAIAAIVDFQFDSKIKIINLCYK